MSSLTKCIRLVAALKISFLLLAAVPYSLRGANSPTTLTLSNSPNTSTYGSPVTLTATISPSTAIGAVTFYDGVTLLGTVPVTNGKAKYTTSLIPTGTGTLRAYYGGDSNDAPSTSATVMQNVQAFPGGGFQAPHNDGVGYEPWSLAIGDFNEDGKPDFAVACIGASVIGVSLGNGDGSFQTPVSYSGVNNPRWIVTGDFNGDGHTDLAVTNFSGNSVTVFLGNGDGTFGSPLTYAIGAATNPYALLVGDFNGDGKADLAVANDGASTVTILLGKGDGTFQAPAKYPSGADQRSIAAGDFNGDGKTDLVVGNYTDGTVTVLLGNGDGSFGSPVTYSTASSGDTSSTTNPRSIVVGDYNGDGKLDLAVANQTTENVALLFGKGDGTFQPAANACPTCPNPAAYLNTPYSVAAADINGDGILDLVTANYGGGNVTLLLGKGDGTFTAIGPFAADTNPVWVAVLDLKGNGLADVITASYGANTVSLLSGIAPSPDISIALKPPAIGSLVQGQSGGAYTITISNVGFSQTAGLVTVTVTLPVGVTAAQLQGSGWTCSAAAVTCTRADSLAALSVYPSIALTLNIAANGPAAITIAASVSGGDDANLSNNTAQDYTTAFSSAAVAKTWSSLGLSNTSLPAAFVNGPDVPILMTDGSIMVHQFCSSNWYKLTPDLTGGYLGGKWTQAASMPAGYAPLYFSSAVLADGRLVAIGGEYNGNGCSTHVETTLGAIYDPRADSWTPLNGPSGWTEVGDATNVVLPDGRFLLAQINGRLMAALDPRTLAWTPLKSNGKADGSSEEGWTLLPDGAILTIDVTNAGQSERYFPLTDTWALAGDTAVPLIAGREMGPQVLRPNGTVFAAGATGHTAIYDPASESWSAGPDFPLGRTGLLAIADAPGTLLPNGNVLVAATAFDPGALGPYQQLSFFFEFDGTNLKPVPAPAGNTNGSYRSHLLLLPTGQVLFTDIVNASVYTPTGSPQPGWAPAITNAPATVQAGQAYTISGTQFNSLSQAVMYGDDYQAATNFPLVRIVNNATGHVVYCRTHDHSTMAVATGSALVSTQFDVPQSIETGSSTIVVVANGIASAPRSVTVAVATSPLVTITAVVGGALSVPPVNAISTDGYFTIFGSGFQSGAPTQESAAGLVDGTFPTQLSSVCVNIGSGRAFLSYVSDTQINAIAPLIPASGAVPVSVSTNCGASNEITSTATQVTVAAAAPEFLYWVQNSNGQDPVIAVGADSSFVGPPGLIAGTAFRPAHPGELITIYGIGFGPTALGPVPGAPPTAADSVSSTSSVQIGNLTASASYAGVTPGSAGLYQLNVTVPTGLTPGNYPIVLMVSGVSTPIGAFLAVGP